jgi:uncharacterized paraquat-inducible protein A
MWKKRTVQEIAEVRSQAKQTKKLQAFLIGIGVTFLFTIFRGRGWSQNHASRFVSLDEMPARLLITIPFGALFGLFFYRSRRQRTMVCPRCEAVKQEDDKPDCTCGGHFEDIEEMKWVK